MAEKRDKPSSHEAATKLRDKVATLQTGLVSMSRNSTARLTLAMSISIILHLSPFIPGWIHWQNNEQGRQITLSVTMQPTQNKASATKTPPKRPIKEKKLKRQKPVEQNVMTVKGRENLAIGKVRAEKYIPQDEQDENTGAAPLDQAVTPEYPAEAKRKGIESCVLAAVHVSVAGEVDRVQIIHADVPELFDQSVIDSQGSVRYLPARVQGENLPSRVLTVVGFTLTTANHRSCANKYARAARVINALPEDAAIDRGMVKKLVENQ
jgi:protein TonB